MLFGRAKNPAKTVLILDVENGSVASALVRLSPREAPKLFGERRYYLPVLSTFGSTQLAREVVHIAREAILNASEVASRLRNTAGAKSQGAQELGTVTSAAVFLAAPWGTPNLAAGKPDFVASVADELSNTVASAFGITPTLHTHAGSAVFGFNALFPQESGLLSSINAEVTELMLLDQGHVVGHATMPVGSHSTLRTLQSHGGLSEHEARSALQLGHITEPLHAAGEHFAQEFAGAARDLLAGAPIQNVYVLALEPTGEWYARALGGEALADIFPHGGAVRALRAKHAQPFIAAHAAEPDLHLMFNALYSDSLNASAFA